jgi:hypothetical protein
MTTAAGALPAAANCEQFVEQPVRDLVSASLVTLLS